MDGFRRNGAWTSPGSSGLTAHESTELAHLEETTTTSLDYPAAESISTEWTDEKHSLYLKSMEVSFVNQLYGSMNSLGWCIQNVNLPDPKSSRQIHTRTPSGEFKVFRGGSWKKINYQRAEGEKADGGHMLLANPWIQHFRSTLKRQAVVCPTLQEADAPVSQAIDLSRKKAVSCGLPTSSKHFCSCHSHLSTQDSLGSKTEVSDQNFIGEEIEGETASRISSSKKMKTLITDTSNNDQVVPNGKSPVTEDATEK